MQTQEKKQLFHHQKAGLDKIGNRNKLMNFLGKVASSCFIALARHFKIRQSYLNILPLNLMFKSLKQLRSVSQ